MDTHEVRSPLADKSTNVARRPISKLKPPSAVKRGHHMLEEEDTKSTQEERVGPQKQLRRSTSNNSINSSTVKNTGKPTLKRQNSCTLPMAKSSQTTVKKSGSSIRPVKSTANRASKPPTSASKSISNQPAKTATGNKVPAKGLKKKRPAWDTKGRLEDLEGCLFGYKEKISDLTECLGTHQSRISDLESLNKHLETTVAVKSQDSAEASAKIVALQSECSSTAEKLRITEKDLEMANLLKNNLQSELDICRQEVVALKTTMNKMTIESMGINTELQSTKLSLAQKTQLSEDRALLIKDLQQELAGCKQQLREDECIRRKLHNTIQELKGNIRVFCRVRPMLPSEEKDEAACNFNFVDDHQVCIDVGPTESITGTKKGATKYDFNFDRVFTPVQSQAHVFEEISQLVQSVLDGYNVCIFAYGQTGSGKTFTMEGDLSTEESLGMIPRALKQVFETSKMLEEKGWEYIMEASFVEIYNETLRDLLGSGDSKVKHEIKLTSTGNGQGSANDVIVTNIKTEVVTSQEQVTGLLNKAYENRAVAATKCNERSSRSHSVFRLKLCGENKFTGEKSQGTLNLVDLAGSERLNSSGSSGARLKETQSINGSLSTLSTVIMSLASKEQYIPYRNSKLTYLLQNSLGGNSKTLMFVNVSPRADSVQETLCSLRFAKMVNQCNIGTAQKKVLK